MAMTNTSIPAQGFDALRTFVVVTAAAATTAAMAASWRCWQLRRGVPRCASSRCDDPAKVRRDGHAEQGRQRRARVRMAEVKGAEGGSAGRKTSGLREKIHESLSRAEGSARSTQGVARRSTHEV